MARTTTYIQQAFVKQTFFAISSKKVTRLCKIPKKLCSINVIKTMILSFFRKKIILTKFWINYQHFLIQSYFDKSYNKVSNCKLKRCIRYDKVNFVCLWGDYKDQTYRRLIPSPFSSWPKYQYHNPTIS